MQGASIHPKTRCRPALARAGERADYGRCEGLSHFETRAELNVGWARSGKYDFSGLSVGQMGSNCHQHLLVFHVQ